MDVNKPVENPALVARLELDEVAFSSEDETRQTLKLLRDATFLMAAQVFHPDGGEPIVEGVMRAGTQINLFTVGLPDGRSAVAVFTDWPSLRAAVGEVEDWKGLIQPGDDVFKMGLQADYPGGAVVNPNGPGVTLPLEPEQIAWMYANTTPSGSTPG